MDNDGVSNTGDAIKDSLESGIAQIYGGPYDPTKRCTHSGAMQNGTTYEPEDCEAHAMFKQPEWPTGEYAEFDWASPGLQW